MKTIFVTGAAGFIASNTCEKLLKMGYKIIGIDNFCDFYDVSLKEKNVEIVNNLARDINASYKLIRGDIRDKELIEKIFSENKIDACIHFAAMAGVRPSIENPSYYVDVNINGLVNILEALRNHSVHKLVFISSSSVYGNNKKVPFSEKDSVDNPISPYAATKKSGELLCYTYHSLFNIDVNCLRYFTVYGPRQRPDLAINKFTRLMLENKAIPMFGDGTTARDYTYVDDIVEGTILSLEYLFDNENVYDIFNLGGSSPISLKELIDLIGEIIGVDPIIERLPMQAGDVNITYSDYSHAKEVLNYSPKVKIKEGLENFIKWYRDSNGK